MALPINIEDLIHQRVVEQNRIEYKEGWNPEPIIHSIAAVANDFDNMGVEEENGRPVFPIKGLDPDSTVMDGKDIIVLWIPGGENRPYKAPEKVYTKKGGEKSNKVYYTDVDDMRPALMADYLKNVGSDLYANALDRSVEAVGTDMHIVSGPTEYRKPLNVGLMFFNERPDEYFSYARIEVVDKPEPTGHGMTEKIFTGPIDKQLKDALSYIHNYIIKEYVTKLQGQAEAVQEQENWGFSEGTEYRRRTQHGSSADRKYHARERQ